jgi:hypothetical protein
MKLDAIWPLATIIIASIFLPGPLLMALFHLSLIAILLYYGPLVIPHLIFGVFLYRQVVKPLTRWMSHRLFKCTKDKGSKCNGPRRAQCSARIRAACVIAWCYIFSRLGRPEDVLPRALVGDRRFTVPGRSLLGFTIVGVGLLGLAAGAWAWVKLRKWARR